MNVYSYLLAATLPFTDTCLHPWHRKTIGGHNPPDITPPGQNAPVSGKAGRNLQDITPLGQNPQYTMYNVVLCYRNFWKLNFRIGGRKPPGRNPWFRTPWQGGSESGGYVRGVYIRQSWNLAFKSLMCDSVGFIQPCHWMGDSNLGGLCPGGYVRSPAKHYM